MLGWNNQNMNSIFCSLNNNFCPATNPIPKTKFTCTPWQGSLSSLSTPNLSNKYKCNKFKSKASAKSNRVSYAKTKAQIKYQPPKAKHLQRKKSSTSIFWNLYSRLLFLIFSQSLSSTYLKLLIFPSFSASSSLASLLSSKIPVPISLFS